MKLILKEWSNSYANTVDDLERLGNKILSVRKSSNQGHTITYRHFALTKRPRKGDLVEFADYLPFNRWVRRRGIVTGTENDYWCVKDWVGIKNTIVSIGMVTKIIKEQLIPIKLFKYM